MKTIHAFLLFLLLLTSLSSLSIAEEKISYCCHLTKEPVLDGRVENDPAWRNVPQATGFVTLGNNLLTSKQTLFKMGYSAEALYIGIECEEPEVEKIKAKFKDMEPVWKEDSIEIFIFPKGAGNYYQFIVNAIGSRYSGTGQGGPKIPLDNWQAKTYKGKDYWSAEIKIPFKNFALTPKSGEVWTGNIARNVYTSGEINTTWAHLSTRFHEPDNFGKIVFSKSSNIINLMKKEIVINLKSVSEYKTELSKKIKDCPSFQKEIASFLKNYEEIKKELPKLNTIKEAHLLFKNSQNLLKEAEKLKGKLLLESFFN